MIEKEINLKSSDHPLARHCDVLTAIETRISLLSMTFMKYVELDLCCFIPGKVIDEIYAVLRSVNSSKTVNRSCEVLQVSGPKPFHCLVRFLSSYACHPNSASKSFG